MDAPTYISEREASILEREAQLDELQSALSRSAEGTGSVALVCGE